MINDGEEAGPENTAEQQDVARESLIGVKMRFLVTERALAEVASQFPSNFIKDDQGNDVFRPAEVPPALIEEQARLRAEMNQALTEILDHPYWLTSEARAGRAAADAKVSSTARARVREMFPEPEPPAAENPGSLPEPETAVQSSS